MLPSQAVVQGWERVGYHMIINAASPDNYEFAGNVYHSDATPPAYYARVGGVDKTWTQWLAYTWVADTEFRQETTDLGSALVPTPSTAGKGDTTLGVGAVRTWNGASIYPGAASCYAGAYQPVQAGVTAWGSTTEPPSQTVNLGWSNLGADGYWIHYGTASGTSEELEVASTAAASISPLTAGIEYFFRVMAFSNEGSLSSESNEVVETPPP